MSTWISVANASRARVFSAENGNDSWMEVKDFAHSASRMHGKDLVTDSPGTMPVSSDAREHEKETFSKELNESLRKALLEGRFHKLFVVAGPQFLGLLRNDMDHEVQKHVSGETTKDLVTQSANDIRGHLPQYF